MQNNSQISDIIEKYLSASSINPSEHQALALRIFEDLQVVFKETLNATNAPIIIPYKDISDIIFNSSYNVNSDTLENFSEYINNLIGDYQTQPRCKSKGQRLNVCHKKIINHILLAQSQKEFINNSIIRTEQLAAEVQKSIDQTKEALEKTQETAEKAEKLAASANKTYNSMFANYITILGIFTAIIVTIFGGLNVAKTVLDYGNAPFSTIVFLAALVVMCVICLLYFLALVIMKLTDRPNKVGLNCAFGGFFAVCIIAMLIAYYQSENKTIPPAKQDTQEQKSTS